MSRIPPYIPSTASQPWRFYAGTVYERIQRLVKDKTEKLEDNEQLEIVILLIDGGRINATSFGYQNPNFVIVYGTDSETDASVEAWLSHTNIQIIARKVSKQDDDESTEPRRAIGFLGPRSGNP